jgi:hypothetical protein
MSFLGRKLRGNFEGELVSDISNFAGRMPGCRIKHRVKENWLKMYDKSGLVLRVETVINNPEEFKVRKKVTRKGKKQTEWVAMGKGVAYLFRYREVSLQANSRYLDALALVDDPTQAKRNLDRVTTPKKDAAGRGCAGFNPLARRDAELFQSLWLASIASKASAIATFVHCLHQPHICEPVAKIQKRKAVRSAEPFAASMLTV